MQYCASYQNSPWSPQNHPFRDNPDRMEEFLLKRSQMLRWENKCQDMVVCTWNRLKRVLQYQMCVCLFLNVFNYIKNNSFLQPPPVYLATKSWHSTELMFYFGIFIENVPWYFYRVLSIGPLVQCLHISTALVVWTAPLCGFPFLYPRCCAGERSMNLKDINFCRD